MGNAAGKLTICFHGTSTHSRPADLSALVANPLDKGLGHSFCYVPPDPADLSSLSKVHSEDLAAAGANPFWSISGASVSANTSTPSSTSLVDLYSYGCVDKSSTFESSTSFSAIPLQPIPRGMINSGPLSGGMDRVLGSGPLERGFMSGPLERGFLSGPLDREVFSGPLENGGGPVDKFKRSFSHGGGYPFGRRGRKRSLMKGIRKVIARTIYSGKNSIVAPIKAVKEGEYWSSGAAENKEKDERMVTMNNGGSLNLSSEGSIEDGLQWAQGKAGEDRVHVVVSEEHGWVFVGIYDGFNGPDAPNYLLSNLYGSIHKELRGLLWDLDKCRSSDEDSGSVRTDGDRRDAEQSITGSKCSARRSSLFEQENYPNMLAKDFDPDWQSNRKRNGIPTKAPRGPARKWEESQRRWKCEWDRERLELDRRIKEQLNRSGSGDRRAINHSEVLNALSRALKKAEEDYLRIADQMVFENPELALMGSCVLAFLMKGEDVYVMNVGDSRAVLAQKAEPDYRIGKVQHDLERIKEETLYDIEASDWDTPNMVSKLKVLQLSVDHSTAIEEEIQRIKREHPDDCSAISNDRVKGSLKVTRAFGAGFLKQPKWNNALLEMFQIDYIGSSPYISCDPSLYHHKLGPRDKFMILSSDGLYQYFTNEEAVSEVELFMELQPEGDPAQHLIEEVLFRAAKKAGMEFHDLLEIPHGDRRRYHDDVSVIIISLEGRIWRSCV